MPVPELDLLKPIDPSITNSDDYEIFVLSNAHVAYESNGKLASLLSAYADTPLKVEGRLEPPARGQAKHYLKKPYKPVDVEVRHVTRFSYGQMTDGESIIWAQGRSGWFEIRPARNYKSIYNDMVEAVDLLYFVTDIYNEPKKKGAGPGAQLVFQEYAEDERFECTDAEAAAQVFHKHRMFLMMCFLNRAQGIGWSSSALYQYFRRHYPKDFDACKARVDGRCPEIPPPQPQRASRSSKVSPTRSAAPTPTTTLFKPRTTRTTAAAHKQQEQHPKKNDNWWEAAALFEFMQKAVNQRILRPGNNHITLDQIAKLIVKRYEIDELETARNVLLVHASNLCYMMDHPRRQSIRFFAEEPIYNELEAGHNLSAIEQKRAESVELKPRRDRTSLREDHSNSSDTSMDDDEEEKRKGKAELFKTPVRRLPGRRRKGARLSILRPKSGKFSGKGKGVSAVSGKGKRPIPDLSTSGDSDDERGEQSSDGDEMGVDTPTQALSPGREKRKFIETDSDEEEEKGRRKRAASASANLDSSPTTIETDEDEDQEEEDTPEENGDDETLPLRLHPTHQLSQEPNNTTSSLSPTIISTPLPTYQANGPRDSWNCTFDGCSQRIYGASKEHGRRLITEHLEDHARGREKFVGILWREREKLNLPVSNLIKKIRDMSEASTSLFPDSSSLEAAAAALRPQPSLIRRPA